MRSCTVREEGRAPHGIDPLDFERRLYRVALKGEVPLGGDGRALRAIEGEPLDACE